MPSITEGQLTFDFPSGWQVSKFDEMNSVSWTTNTEDM